MKCLRGRRILDSGKPQRKIVTIELNTRLSNLEIAGLARMGWDKTRVLQVQVNAVRGVTRKKARRKA